MASLATDPVPVECPSSTRVLAFLDKRLPVEDQELVGQHVGACRACRKLLISLEQTNPEDAVSTGDGSALDQVGRYRLGRRLGQGGMGTVYAAHDPQLDRQVALKLVRPDVAELGGIERLIREGRALARLSHPHVVAVHDAGIDRDRVYIVMELIEGQNLATWLRQERRSTSDVVRMFVAAGRGIAAAHRAGVTHRDVKPENILVDRSGIAKVADFGLAGSLSPEDSEDRLTLPNAVMGTPAFMSPEQRRGEDVGPATDQYSLAAALRRALVDDDPQRRLPAHLASVLARAMAASAADRFGSMDELVAALDLDSRSRRRHRRVFAATTLGVVALSSLTAFAIGRTPAPDPALAACESARDDEAKVWTAADADAITAAFLATGKPFAVETTTKVRAAADGYAKSLATTLAQTCSAAPRNDPARTQLAESLGCLAERRAGFADAIAQLRVLPADRARYAVSVVHALQPVEDCANPVILAEDAAAAATPIGAATRAEVSRELGQARNARSLGRYQESAAHAKRAVELARASGGVMLARALLELGDVTRLVEGFPAAEVAYREASTIAELAGADHVRARAMVSMFTAIVHVAGREKEALSLRPLVEAAIQRAGKQTALAPMLRQAVGVAKLQQWQTAAALEDFQAALASAREVLPPDDPRLADYLLPVGVALGRMGRDVDAIAVFDEAVRIGGEAWGKTHPDTARLAINRALRRAAIGRWSEALDELGQIREVLAGVLGPETAEQLQISQAMGACYYVLKRYDDAMREYTGRQDALVAAGRGKSAEMAASWVDLGDVELARKQYDRALEHYRRGLDETEALVGTTDARLAIPLMRIGAAELEAKHADRAIAPLERSLAVYAAAGTSANMIADTQLWLAKALWQAKRDPARARSLAETARDVYAGAGAAYTARKTEAEAWLKEVAR